MPPELLQIVFLLFLAGIVVVAYEMKTALQRPFCAECPHCLAAREAARREADELQDWYGRRYGLRRPDDKDNRR